MQVPWTHIFTFYSKVINYYYYFNDDNDDDNDENDDENDYDDDNYDVILLMHWTKRLR